MKQYKRKGSGRGFLEVMPELRIKTEGGQTRTGKCESMKSSRKRQRKVLYQGGTCLQIEGLPRKASQALQ